MCLLQDGESSSQGEQRGIGLGGGYPGDMVTNMMQDQWWRSKTCGLFQATKLVESQFPFVRKVSVLLLIACLNILGCLSESSFCAGVGADMNRWGGLICCHCILSWLLSCFLWLMLLFQCNLITDDILIVGVSSHNRIIVLMNLGIQFLSEDHGLFTKNMSPQKVEHRVPDLPQL
jgi:hypothetical protein